MLTPSSSSRLLLGEPVAEAAQDWLVSKENEDG
jgi:hypothetical protein